MTLQDLIQEARTLSINERKQLVKALVDLLDEPPQPRSVRKQSARAFRGVGAALYDGTDAQAHVNQLRSEWDERP